MSDAKRRIESRSLARLLSLPNTVRPHARGQLERLARVIDQRGFLQPVLIDEQNRVLVGHVRVEAARLAGLKEVPVRLVDEISLEELRALERAELRLVSAIDQLTPEELERELAQLRDLELL